MSSGCMPRLTEEDHPNLTSHIEGSKECCDRQQPVRDWVRFRGIQQNFILRPETREREDTRKRKRSDHVEPERYGHGLAQSTHITHVTGVKDLMFFLVVFFLLLSFFA